MLEMGGSKWQVARAQKAIHSAISTMWSSYQTTGSVHQMHSRGGPLTTLRTDLSLTLLTRRNPFMNGRTSSEFTHKTQQPIKFVLTLQETGIRRLAFCRKQLLQFTPFYQGTTAKSSLHGQGNIQTGLLLTGPLSCSQTSPDFVLA